MDRAVANGREPRRDDVVRTMGAREYIADLKPSISTLLLIVHVEGWASIFSRHPFACLFSCHFFTRPPHKGEIIAKTMNAESFPTAIKDRIVDKIRSNKLTIIVVRDLCSFSFSSTSHIVYSLLSCLMSYIQTVGTNRLR